ncbi:MAG: GNAT family protein [Candidatus Paceibacterota bacterium]
MEKENRVRFLEAQRVYLRPILREDTPLLTCWVNDPSVYQYLDRCLPAMEAEEEAWIESLHKRIHENVVLMICLVEGDRPIGTMGLHNIDHKNGTAVTGALIGEKDCWSNGYGTEAKMVLLNYAFNTLNLRKVCSNVFAFNKRSRRYSEKCGYHIEGVLKKEHFAEGKYVDKVLMAVFKKDFMPLWRKFKKEHLS